MASIVSVSNLALQKIGADDRIVDPDEDRDAARALRAVWDDVRQACIRGGDKVPRWNFANTYFQVPALAPNSFTVPFGWTSGFRMPEGFLRLTEIVDPAAAIDDYRLIADETVITKTAGPLRGWFLKDIVEPEKWDALFVETFAARLGFQVADRVTGDRGRKQDCWAEYQTNIAAAARVDAMENPPEELEESDWVLARYQRL